MPREGKSEEDTEALIERIHARLAGREDVRVVLVFGSRARGTGRVDSDVDIAVDAPGVDLLELGAELGRDLGLTIDVVDVAEASIPLLDNIVREGLIAHEGYSGAAGQWRSRTLAALETDRPWYARMSDAWLAHIAKEGLSRG